jgi:LysM repeat protein
VDHKVTPKENFYSMGRAFNVHPKHIALFNGLDMSKGLGLGQIVKIPLSDTNFTQKTDKGIPVYYVTGNGETLYRVSTNNKNVLMENLRKWNHLSSDKLANGTKLIVGYLTTNETQAMAVNAPSQKTETVTKPAENKDLVKTDVINKPEQKKEEVKSGEVKNEASNKPEQKKAEATQPKDETKKNKEVVQAKEEVKPKTADQGYFKTSFDQQVKQQPASKEQTVTSGIFKTASGWNDAKYYVLMNGAEPGTIVRITNPGNNKTIYAKLLGEMNEKQGQGLNIRISNAAASALDISETDKFIVKLNY